MIAFRFRIGMGKASTKLGMGWGITICIGKWTLRLLIIRWRKHDSHK